MEYVEVKDLNVCCDHCEMEEYVESPLAILLERVRLNNCEYTIMHNGISVATIKPTEVV